jgi:hypothetical protein
MWFYDNLCLTTHYYQECSGQAAYTETHPKSLKHFYEETGTTHFNLNI